MKPTTQICATLGINIVDIALKIAIDFIKIVFWSAIAFGGWLMFHNGGAWYWSVGGVLLMLNGFGAVLPAIEMGSLLFGLTVMPFFVTKEILQIKKNTKEAKTDAVELWAIAKDFLPREAYDKFHIAQSGHTIQDMYDMYFAILIMIWIRHLDETRKDSSLFKEEIKGRFGRAFALYETLVEDVQASLLQDYSYIAGITTRNEDFSRWITTSVLWVTNKLTKTKEDKFGLGDLFVKLIVQFNKANRL